MQGAAQGNMEAMMARLLAGISVAAVVVLVGGTAIYVMTKRASDPFAECRGGQVAGGSIGGPFTLVDENGTTVTERDVIKGPTLIYFGYTFCPDVCPLDNARNAEAVDVLTEMGYEVTPVMISFDPKRDTPEVLRDFTDNLHPRMIGLTGTEAQILAASQAYKTYSKVRDPAEEYYLFDHSTFTYLMAPGADGTPQFLDFFRNDAPADEVAARTACFLNKS
jgi:protein SCO1/2